MDLSSWKQRCSALSTAQIAILVFCASALIYAASPQGRPAFRDLVHGAEVTRVALTLADTGNFSDPYFVLPTGPTAHTAPAYVFLYAAVAKVFGEGFAGERVLWALNIGFLALQLALLPVLSERLGMGVLPGVIAAAFGAVFQPYRILPEWESQLTGALLVLLCVLTVPFFRAPRNWEYSGLLGFLWGIAILTNPQCVLLLFAWAHFATLENSPEQLQRARRAMLIVVAGAALACLPWFVRNYQRFHTVFFIRDDLGLALSSSNNSCAQATSLANFTSGCSSVSTPNENVGLALDVLQKGEIRFNQERLHVTLQWISANPRAFALLTARRFQRYWFPYLNSFRYAVPSGILTVFSVLGLALMFRKNRRAAWILASTLALYPLVHYIAQFEARYRYPIYWATFLPAAYAMLEIGEWLKKGRPSQASVVEEQRELVPSLK